MIACNANILFGQPALVGRRLTVYDIVTKIYYEDNIKIAIEDYSIDLREAKEAASYCMNLKCKEDKELIHFCDGCLLRTIDEGWNFNKNDYIEIQSIDQKIVVAKDEKTLFSGSIQEFEDSEFGKVTWLLAEEINKKYFLNDNFFY